MVLSTSTTVSRVTSVRVRFLSLDGRWVGVRWGVASSVAVSTDAGAINKKSISCRKM